MSLLYYCSMLFLVIHSSQAAKLKCYECNGMIFNSSLTIDKIPPPTNDDCAIIPAESSCSVRIGWYKDNTTEVYYGADTPLPVDSVMAKIERKVTTWSGEYETRRFLIYNCHGTSSAPCNTVDNVRRAVASTTFATDEQIEKFDWLIVPTTDFNSRQCLKLLNSSDCREPNLASCQQCIGIVQYAGQPHACATCPAGKAIANFFDYETTFFLENRTRSDVVRLGCRKYGACNSLENIDRIKNTLHNDFSFGRFTSSSSALRTYRTAALALALLLVTASCME